MRCAYCGSTQHIFWFCLKMWEVMDDADWEWMDRDHRLPFKRWRAA